MKFIDRLEYKFRRFGIPNLMIYITATMLAVFALEFILRIPLSSYLYFNRALFLQGQIWRILTFVFIPPNSSLLWILLSLYFYYFIGTSLENTWGSTRFTLYYLFGVIGTLIAGFIAGAATNTYLNLSLFFAFAHLYPNHQVLLFFVIPVKIKYLAYLDWFFFLVSFIRGGMVTRLAIVFSIFNYLLFFGPDIYSSIKERIRTSRSRREFRKQMQRGRDMWR